MSASTSVPAAFQAAFERLGDRPILEDAAGTVTYSALLGDAAALALALERRGLRPGERVGLWADNSRRWILADLAIQAAGGVNVPRGTDTPEAEIVEILRHAEASFVLVHDAQHARAPRAHPARPARRCARWPCSIRRARGADGRRLVEEGRRDAAVGPHRRSPSARRASGPTTWRRSSTPRAPPAAPRASSSPSPTSRHQLEEIPGFLDIGPDDVFLSILPPWHIFERIVEYVALTQGARLVYTDLRRFRQDLAAKRPTFVPSVPRIWEAVHDARAQGAGGGRPRCAAGLRRRLRRRRRAAHARGTRRRASRRASTGVPFVRRGAAGAAGRAALAARSAARAASRSRRSGRWSAGGCAARSSAAG